jgi:hypothetical protein
MKSDNTILIAQADSCVYRNCTESLSSKYKNFVQALLVDLPQLNDLVKHLLHFGDRKILRLTETSVTIK